MSRRKLLLVVYIVVPLLAAAASYMAMREFFTTPFNPADTTAALFEVLPEENLKAIAQKLEEDGFIRNHITVTLLAKLQKKDKLVMAGEYEFSPAMTPQQILDAMVEGKMILRKVTVKEGLTVKEIGPLLETAGISSKTDFDSALADPSLLTTLNIPASSFEGYLFPETYRFQRSTAARKIIEKMRSELDKHWDPAWNARLIELEMTRHQILTLASIIEKESGNAEEQPLISSVFHNRLAKGMRLQADPTVIYGITNFDGNITKEHLQTATPYNTYVIQGLPPGPIANPGRSAIQAALYPKESSFLFFVGNGKGKHIFSETLNEHNNAVNLFQRGQGSAPEAEQPASVKVSQPTS